MEKSFDKVIIDQIAIKALERYSEQYQDLYFLGGFKNYVYEFKLSDVDCILRLTKSDHRQKSDILGELEWIQYLNLDAVNVSTPLKSIHGNLLELITLDKLSMIACVFKKAKGKQLIYPEYLGNKAVFEELGKITGMIHKSSKQYESYMHRRYENFDNFYMNHLISQIPKDKLYISNALNSIKITLSQLEKKKEAYGIIHGDINIGNFCVDDNEITLFDFDECHYSWYVEDIAIQLYYTIYVMLDDAVEERQKMADMFMSAFMKGYVQENILDQKWIDKIPIFLKLRELIVHIGLFRAWDFDNLNPWRQHYFEQSKLRITNKISIVECKSEWVKMKDLIL